MNEVKNQICKDTQLCDWFNKESCDNCILKTMSEKDKKNTLEDFNVTLSNLPDNIDDIFGEECQFCIESPKKRECYAKVNIVHPEPYSERALFGIGPKTKSLFGSILQLDMSCCSACQSILKKYAFLKRLTAMISLAAYILFLVILFATGIIRQNGVEWAMLILVGFAVLAVIASEIVSRAYINKNQPYIRSDIFKIPMMEELYKMGWSIFEDRVNPDHIYKLKLSKGRTNSLGRLKSKAISNNEPSSEQGNGI